MDITLLIRLDRLGKDGRALIHLRVTWQSNKVRLSTGLKVKPSEWDSEKQKIKPKAEHHNKLNGQLDTYRSGISSFIYTNQNNGVKVTEDMVRAEVERIRVQSLGKAPKKKAQTAVNEKPLPTLLAFNEQYRKEHIAGRSDSWQTSVRVVGNHLASFRPDLAWSGLTLPTLNLFKVYLQEEEECSDATLRSYIGLLKGMLKYAGKSGLPVPADWTYLEVKKPGDALLPALEKSELTQVLNTNLTKPDDIQEIIGRLQWWAITADDLEVTRWYFAIACHTGLRHSDLWQLQHPKIIKVENTACLEIIQHKTQKRVPIPLADDIYHLIRKPPQREAPVVRGLYNIMLKSIGHQSKLDRLVTTGTYYRGELMAETQPLFKTMSSHIARRTFATMMNQGGMPTRTLQEIMGHASLSSTEKYMQVPNSTIIEQTLKAWHRINS